MESKTKFVAMQSVDFRLMMMYRFTRTGYFNMGIVFIGNYLILIIEVSK
jgi:hypothetical protein